MSGKLCEHESCISEAHPAAGLIPIELFWYLLHTTVLHAKMFTASLLLKLLNWLKLLHLNYMASVKFSRKFTQISIQLNPKNHSCSGNV